MNKIFLKTILFIGVITIFTACDKEYSNLGADLVGEDHYGMDHKTIEVTMPSNVFTGPVQTNNLDINAFGIYNNDKFGKTTANFVTQVQLASVAPTINTSLLVANPVQSVELYIPYKTTQITANTTGNEYKLEDIYGNTANAMKLSIYENKYFLSDLDLSDNNSSTKFYSNQQSDIENLIVGDSNLNDASNTSENTAFKFVATPHTVVDGTTTTYLAPGMKINLNKTYFENKIVRANASNLINNAQFIQYFRGLYFKMEQIGTTDGAMALMNFKKGTITIKYKEKTSTTDATPVDKSIVLNLTGNTINLLNNDFSTTGTTYNSSPLADRIYLRGGDGKYLTFDARIPATDLKKMKDEKWQINDASLVFNIDNATLGNAVPEPIRLNVYDETNKRPMIDYYYDGTTSSYANFGKYIFGGYIDVDPTEYYNTNLTTTSKRGTKYKIRLTNYLRNVVTKDSTQVRMAVAVSQNYTTLGMAKRRNTSSYIPVSSVMNPLGTILFGNNLLSTDINYDKRLKLEIWYTKPD